MKLGSTDAKRRSRSAPPMAEINVIPLVDIILVLLIIFMVTTAFVNDAGLNMKLPAAKTAEAPAATSQDMNIALTSDNGLFLDGKAISTLNLRAAMVERSKANPETRVIIKGDENIPYKRIVEVMDAAKQSNLARVVLGTDPEGRGQ